MDKHEIPGEDIERGRKDVVKEGVDYVETKIPVQRVASADEIARCIVFVASLIAGFMTGATVDINGGREMR